MESIAQLLEAELGAEVVYEGPEPPPTEWYEDHSGLHIEIIDSDPDPPGQTEPPPEEEDDSQTSTPTSAWPKSLATRRVRKLEWQRLLTKAENLTATERHVGLTLAVWMDADGGGAFPKQSTLAEACGRSEKTVGRALHAIEAAGYLHIQRTGRASRYMATVPEGGDIIDLSRSDTWTGSDRTPGPDQMGHLDPIAITRPITKPTTKHQPSYLTEANQIDPDQLEDRMFEHAIREAQRRQADGRNIHSLPGYARKIAPDFHDQAAKELRGEQRAVAIAACPLCDDNGFRDIDNKTRIRCDHVIREGKQHHG